MMKFAMTKINRNHRLLFVISLIFCSVFLFTQCVHEEKPKTQALKNISFDQFAGSEACMNCHKNIYEDHIHTAHFLTSRPGEEKYIKGSFVPGKNTFTYDVGHTVTLEKRDSGFYQVVYYEGEQKIARRFDVAFGSGAKGQTSASWVGNNLYELPISYFTTANQWANSPGFPAHVINFNRPVTSRCLECHSTFANRISAPNIEPEKFDKAQLIYGVDCEKCHGPAAAHVSFHTQNPNETKAKYIINPATLTKQQNLELCTLCHGGRLKKTAPSFQFTVGDTLSHYFIYDTASPDPAKIDMHGNQYGLLRASKCFRISNTMTCTTCHDPHKNERGKLVLLSQRCITCHSTGHENICKMSATLGAAINENCIDCHMPKKPSQLISLLLPGDKIPTAALIRSHLISINPEETKKYLEGIKKSRKIH